MRWFLISTTVCVLSIPCLASEEKKSLPETNLNAVVSGNTAFAFDLFHWIRKEPGNQFISPVSLSTGLAMAYLGARNQTAREMEQTLHLPKGVSIPETFQALQAKLQPKNKSSSLNLANALWIKSGSSIQPLFMKTIQTSFAGSIREIDFQQDGVEPINRWVREKTDNQIPEILSRDDLNENTRMILANAISFKGKWSSRFMDNREEYFFPTNRDAKKISFMTQANSYPYVQTQTVQVLEMPYDDERLSMVVILPLEMQGLRKVEELLTLENWQKWMGWLEKTKVNVYFPPFQLENNYRMNKTLAGLGMPSAFLQTRADFSGVSPDLFIHKVIHKARCEVDAEGTKASGATVIIESVKSEAKKIREPLNAPPTFRASHPFLFVIRDRPTGSILFIGRVEDLPGTK